MTTTATADAAGPAALAFEQLYRTEYARVVAIAQRVLADRGEAEDVAQDVFAACAAAGHGDESTPSRAWLHTATVRRALNAVRSRRRRAAREAQAVTLAAPLAQGEENRIDPLAALVRDERRDAIRRVMRRLKGRDAALLALRYGGELSYREIADALDVPPPHVGTLLARAERAFVREVRRAPRVVALALAATLAAVLAIIVFPPARSYAGTLVERLRVAAIVTVLEPHFSNRVSPLAELARISVVDVQDRRTAAPLLPSISEASRRSGFHVRVPATVPDEIRSLRSAYIQPLSVRYAFRLDAVRARRRGLALPRSLRGATVTVSIGAFVQVRYGVGRVRDRLPGTGQPTVVVNQLAAPVVTVRGTTLARLASWYAAQPSVDRAVSAQVRALTDPLVALPLPVRIDRERATRVPVDGVTGFAVTSLFNGSSYVVWVKDGIVYAVGGSYPLERVLAIADSLR